MDYPGRGPQPGFDKLNALIAVIVTMISFVIYRLTVAPTLSFWDCGEFIASAHILGNPHPPGTPLLVLIGRVFDLLPLGADPAFRINLISVMSSTFTAMFSYLILVRLVSSWYQGTDHYRTGRIIAYAAGFIGALFVAFSRTHWNNSVETETGSPAIFLMMTLFWLSLKWLDYRYSRAGQRIIIMVAFLALLSVGVHLTVFLIMPVVMLLFSLKSTATRTHWAVLSGFFILQLVLIIVLATDYSHYKIFLALVGIQLLALAIYLRGHLHWPVLLAFCAILPIMVGTIPFLVGITTWLVISSIVWFVRREKMWMLSCLIVLFGIAGYSIHVYIPVRSAHHPIINENTPGRDFRTLVNFLDRKQYGSMSMTERMFVRRGVWENQFGDHARMGFWRFFKDQYAPSTVFPLFLVIGLFGLGMMAYKNPSLGYIFLALVLISSVGLILYMNFADGARYDKATGDAYQEVRDRDYFFAPGYVLFGLAIGLGMAGLMEYVRKATAKLKAGTHRLAVYGSLILVLTPLIPAQANYFANDRSRDLAPYNYAYNILNSCEKNAILFTSGDNDTFPLWCLQEVYNVRRDVRVFCFSLMNTDWYAWQMKHFDSLSVLNAGVKLEKTPEAGEMITVDGKEIDPLEIGIRPGVPISLADDQILWNTEVSYGGQTISRPAKPFYDRVRKKSALLVPTLYEGATLKVSQLIMEDVILTNGWRYPIYFSSAAGEMRDSPLRLMERCYRVGTIIKLSREITGLEYLVPESDSLFFQVYRYDYINDTLVAQPENTSGVVLSYPEKMLDYRNYFLSKGDTAKADTVLEKLCELIPYYWLTRMTQAERYRQRGDSIRAMEAEREMLAYQLAFLNRNPDNIFFWEFTGMAYYAINEQERALEYLLKAWDLNHDKEHLFRTLLGIYAERRQAADMIRIAREFKQYHDDNPMANEIIRSAQSLYDRQGPTGPPPGETIPPPTTPDSQ